MNPYWKSQFVYWTTVQAKTPEQQRRGHLLSLFLLLIIAINIVLLLSNTWSWLVHEALEARGFALLGLIEIGIFAAMWLLNRRGRTTLIAHLFLSFIVLAVSTLSESAFISAGDVGYIIPIIMAGFVLSPTWSFAYAALATLGYTLRFQSANVSIPYLDGEIVILFGLAVVTYLIASRYDSALKRAEENEERYRKLINSARDVIFTISTDGKFTSLNPSFETYTGWPRDEWLGRSFDELIAEDERPRARDYFNRALQSGTLRALRLRVPTRAGETLVVELNVSPQFKEGHVVGLLGIARDMTEEQRAGDALKASERRFRALIENSSDAVSLISADGSILYESQSVSRVLGYAPEELIGRNVFELLHPDDLPQVMPIFSEILQQPHKVMTATVRYRHKDGTWLWIEGFGHNLLAEPAVQAIVVNYRDITERKQAGEVLRESEGRYRMLFEANPHPMWVYDLETLAFLTVNEAAVAHYGYTRNEFLNMTIKDIRLPDEIPALEENLAQATEKLQWSGPWKHRKKDGTLIDVEIISHKLVLDERPARLVLANDITKRKQAEEKIQRQNQRLKVLREIDTAILSADSVESIVSAALSHIRELIDCRRASLALIDWGVNEALIFDVRTDSETTIPKGTRVPLALFQDMNQTLSKNQPVLINDLNALADPPPQIQAGIREGFRSLCILPLFSQETLIGAFSMSSEIPGFFDEEKMNLGREVANQVAIAIENARLFAAEQRRRQEITAIAEVSRDISSTLQLDAVLERIASYAKDLLSAETSAVYLAEPTRPILRASAAIGPDAEEIKNDLLQIGEGILGNIAMQKSGEIVNDTAVDPRAITIKGTEDTSIEHLIGVPVLAEDRLTGLIAIWRVGEEREFKRTDLEFLNSLAQQVSIAIENARLYEETRQRAEESAILYETTRDFITKRNLTDMLETIAVGAMRLLHTAGGGIYLYDVARGDLYTAIDEGPGNIPGIRMQLGEGGVGRVAQTRQPLIVNDYQKWEGRSSQYTDAPIGAILEVPMLYNDKLIGVLVVSEPGEAKREFSEADAKLLALFAAPAALAIENTRLFEAEQNRRREAETLREAAQRITSTLDQEQAIQLILEQLAKVVSYESASIQLLRDGYLEIVGGQGWSDPLVAMGVRFPIPGDNPNSAVVLERRPVVLGNVQEVYSSFNITPHSKIQSWLGVPLIARDRVIGMFAVDHGQLDFFTDADVQMVNAFAAQAAIAIENARLYEETQRRLHEVEAINEIGLVLSQTLELDTMLESILQAAIHAIPAAERGSVLLSDEDENLRIQAVWGYTDPRVRASSFPPKSGYSALSFREQRAILIPDVRADETIRYDGDIPEMLMGGSAMAVPLIVKDRAIGVIAIDTPMHANAFNEGDLYLFKTMAASAVLAIENARLFKETLRRLSDLEILQTISTALRAAKTLDEALPIILDQLIKLLDVGGAMLETLDLSSGEIVTELAHGTWAPVTGMRTPSNVGVSGHVISTGQPYITNDLMANGLVVRPDLVGGLNAAACVPIIAQHKPIGALWVGRQTPITEEEVTLLTTLGEMVGNTIHRMSLREQTERLLEDLQASNMELTQAYDTTLEGWAKALELRDRETEGHARRVTELTLRLARYMRISEEELVNIHRGVLLHDIGKMGVPDHVLKKTGPLTEVEWIEMRQHPQHAYNMLSPIAYLRAALDIPYCHHEHWDGSGYPRGLKGDQIPLSARIFSIVDIWDALLSDRPYRKAWPRNKVIHYIKDNAGKILDPAIMEIFLTMIGEESELESKLPAE